MKQGETLIEARGLKKVFQMGDHCIEVLRDVNLKVQKGEILSIIGTSGAGKSTLLHILGMLDVPTEGTVSYGEREVAWASSRERARIRREEVGFVFQFYHLIPELTALENVALAGMMGRKNIGSEVVSKSFLMDRAEEILRQMGLGERLGHRPPLLSGGERQRVAIARALLAQPAVVLCDEPTGNLDEKTSREIEEVLVSVNRDLGQTLVLVTHDQDLASRSHRTLRMEHGILHPVVENAEEENLN